MGGLEGGQGEQPSWLGRTEGREQSCVMAPHRSVGSGVRAASPQAIHSHVLTASSFNDSPPGDIQGTGGHHQP